MKRLGLEKTPLTCSHKEPARLTGFHSGWFDFTTATAGLGQQAGTIATHLLEARQVVRSTDNNTAMFYTTPLTMGLNRLLVILNMSNCSLQYGFILTLHFTLRRCETQVCHLGPVWGERKSLLTLSTSSSTSTCLSLHFLSSPLNPNDRSSKEI